MHAGSIHLLVGDFENQCEKLRPKYFLAAMLHYSGKNIFDGVRGCMVENKVSLLVFLNWSIIPFPKQTVKTPSVSRRVHLEKCGAQPFPLFGERLPADACVWVSGVLRFFRCDQILEFE